MTGQQPPTDERRRHFQLQVQRTRAASYAIACGCGVVFTLAGTLDLTFGKIFLLGGAALASALIFSVIALVPGHRRLHAVADPLWLLADLALITWAIAISGGLASPWFPWYLANIGAAAFVFGLMAALVMAVADTAAYVALLVHLGHVSFADASAFEPMLRMAFLYGASFLFLRGVGLLKDRQRVIKALRDDESRKIEELTRLTAELDQRTRELEDANLRIREADRMKSQFLANMSHELRTPLNSIIGFSDVLLNRLPKDMPPRFGRFLSNIHASGQHLLGIINDLLDLSKIEAGRMELCLEPVELALVVQGVCSIMHGSAHQRHIGFTVELPEDLPAIEADPVKIKQILYNLVSNAVKFSDDGATVTITATRVDGAAGEPDVVRLAVVDAGVGIDPVNHRVIFEEFRQVDGSSTRSHGGTGLGLALVKRLVELHGGTISVTSALGRGSTFTVTLPVRFLGDAATVAEPLHATLDLPEEEGARVLVVEDDPTAFEVMRAHLAAASYVPVRARNGDEAVALAHQVRPVAITLDIILPGPDGWEVLRRLKADPTTAAIPVIMVSVLDNHDLAVTLGAADYLTKPVTAEALISRLGKLAPRTPGRDAAPHLLLIDDDPGLHELMEEKLVSLGYRVAHALNGREGLASAVRAKPELIILDLMMEEMDGFEVASRLKAEEATAAIPVVVLTAKEMDRADHQRLRGKIAALVGKVDIPGDRLVQVIERVLKEGSRGEA